MSNSAPKVNPELDLTPAIRMQCHCRQIYPGEKQCPFFKNACPNYMRPMSHAEFRHYVASQH